MFFAVAFEPAEQSRSEFAVLRWRSNWSARLYRINVLSSKLSTQLGGNQGQIVKEYLLSTSIGGAENRVDKKNSQALSEYKRRRAVQYKNQSDLKWNQVAK